MGEFDSRPDTYEHILKVQRYVLDAAKRLIDRAHRHDASKLVSPEVETFDAITPRLAHTEYGSDEYRATLREFKPGIEHHQKSNSHHPEYYEDGIRGMSLLDLLEMVCDWKAAGERTKNGDIMKSIEISQQRFGFSDELADILRNTAKELRLVKASRHDHDEH
jgi:hypothetical protein